jgi:hypothetical protein
MSPPSSGRRASKKHAADSAACFMLVPWLAYALTLKMETCSSETSVDFQWTKWHYTPEDIDLHSHCDNLKYHNEGSVVAGTTRWQTY